MTKRIHNHHLAPSSLTRLDFMGQAAITGLSGFAAATGLAPAAFASDRAPTKRQFAHCAYNGWITDLATAPNPHATWPSIRLDEPLLGDFHKTFAWMQRLGFNEIPLQRSQGPGEPDPHEPLVGLHDRLQQ